MTRARPEACRVLMQVLRRGRSLDQALAGLAPDLGAKEQALATELCYGVLRYQPRLAAISDALLRKPLAKKDWDLRIIIWLGLYQLAYMRIPDHAAVAESVDLIGRGKSWAKGLVNAVLRRFTREREQLLSALPNSPEVAFAHPQWLCESLRQAWPMHWQALLRANNERAPMTLRVNQRRCDRDRYLDLLAAAGTPGRGHAHAPQAVVLERPTAAADLPGFTAGWVSVQDAGAQLAALLLDIQPGQRVLDACAAPGGKTAHILELADNDLDLTAIDIDSERNVRIADNLSRLGLTARVLTADAANSSDWWDGRAFDRILLDAPCSATGVIRRHPDIKWLRRSGDIQAFSDRQFALLEAAFHMLREGGRLLYATCSVLPAENAAVVAQFLNTHASARSLDLELPKDTRQCAPGWQILSGQADMDGFFYAGLTKTPTNNL